LTLNYKRQGSYQWGTFSITELESIKRPFGLGIERDLYFKEQRFKEIIKEHDLER
jgi:hypothetical protein